MANHTATKKSIRKTITRTAINRTRVSRIRTFIKKVEAAVAAGDQENAKSAFLTAQSEIMRGVSHNVVKKNTASRKISRLAAKVKTVCVAN